jgi:EAL domain-containing protein (putative c-di-GMP-specific phosphodiesterase class I)
VDVSTGAMKGVEALVRWPHPTRGLLYPDAFLGLAEYTGTMGRLTELVLDLALSQHVAWRNDGLDVPIAVNLSASNLLDAEFPSRVAAHLEQRQVRPDALQLEITEETLMVDPVRTLEVLDRLRGLGLTISIDDYGTGYSSLAYLRDLPVHELKLDKSFITPMVDDPRSAAIVHSTVELAHSLGLVLVAEGVETREVLAQLEELGCDIAQGYFICRPIPAADLTEWLRARACGPLASASSAWR